MSPHFLVARKYGNSGFGLSYIRVEVQCRDKFHFSKGEYQFQVSALQVACHPIALRNIKVREFHYSWYQ